MLRPTAGTILWRGVALDLEDAYRAKLGKTIVFWGFTSTTSDMSALDAFIPDDAPSRTLFSITTGLAADLRPYSAYAGEGELLLPAGNVFEVVNVKRFSRSASRPCVHAPARTPQPRSFGAPARRAVHAGILLIGVDADGLFLVGSNLTIVELKAVANLLGLPV
jgi:hypothetical protein